MKTAVPPAPKIHHVLGRKLFAGIGDTPDAAVVNTVSVAVPLVVAPDNAIGPPTVHVGGTVADDGVTVHVSATEPVNPPLPVAVIVEVPVCPGVAIVTAVELKLKEPTVVIVIGTDAEVDVA